MDVLPLPTEVVPLNSEHAMARYGFTLRGQGITLLTNHSKAMAGSVGGDLYLYNVTLLYDDGSPIDGKETFDCELSTKGSFDGKKSLFTVSPLPQDKLEYTVILEDFSSNRAAVNQFLVYDSSPKEGVWKRIRRPVESEKSFKIAAKVPVRAITNALPSQESENSQEESRVLDIILSQDAGKQCCLFVHHSFFHKQFLGGLPLNNDLRWCTKMSSTLQRSYGVAKKLQERMSVMSDELAADNCGVNALLHAARGSISSSFTESEGLVLSAPKVAQSHDIPINVFVRNLDGRSICLLVTKSDSIEDIKQKVEDKCGVPANQQRLLFSRKEMLSNSGMKRDCIIHLLLRLKGGMQPRRVVERCKRLRDECRSAEQLPRRRRVRLEREVARVRQLVSTPPPPPPIEEAEVHGNANLVAVQRRYRVMLFEHGNTVPRVEEFDFAGAPLGDIEIWAESEIGAPVSCHCVFQGGPEEVLSNDLWETLWENENTYPTFLLVIFRAS